MILLCGIPSEAPIALVHKALTEMKAPCLILNQRKFASTHLEFQIENGEQAGQLTLEGWEYELSEIHGVYSRLMDDLFLPEIHLSPDNSMQREYCRRFHTALVNWLEITPARVVNRYGPMGSNSSKPFQAQLISNHGFLIPQTLITNNPELVLKFHKEHGRIIYKSISGIRSIVQELTTRDLERLHRIRWCPTQFQVFVEGTNVRVHVVDRKVFATRIETTATDYRYSQRQGGEIELIPVELDDELTQRCVQLAAALQLPFAGIDLKITPENQVYCFEVNPSPGFSFYEQSTGQPISRALAEYLDAGV